MATTIRHTPMLYLRDENGHHIGFICGHCQTLYTENMTVSKRFTDAMKPNASHRAREEAAHRLLESGQPGIAESTPETPPA